MPGARVIGVIAAVASFWAVTNGVIFTLTLRVADQRLDTSIHDDMDRPDDPMETGSLQSFIAWRRPGRARPSLRVLRAASGAAERPLRCADTARALFEEVYGYWTTLPRNRRPSTFMA